MWNRRFALDVQIEHTVKRYEATLNTQSNLKVDFSVEKTIGGIGEAAEVTIYGLPLEDIRYLCTALVMRGKNPPPRNFVQLSAGYPEDYGIIFQGGIWHIVPDVDSPDMSVKISCLSNYFDNSSGEFEFAGENVSYADVGHKIASFFAIPFEDSSTLSNGLIINNPSFKCTGLQAVDKLRSYAIGKLDVFISGGVLYIMDSMLSLGNPIKLSSSTGLIGTPQPTVAGANIRTLLRPSLQAGKLVEVTSDKLMMTSGVYRIVNLKHSGSTRGEEFYSEINGQKV